MRVNLLFGFLGSGKTTLARRLLQERGGDCKTALIVNEFGDVGIDGDILRGANVDMIELNSGCLCCTLRGSMVLAIEELRARKSVERVIIEATGLAQPGDMLETLADPSFTVEHTVGPLVTVVDAAKFPKLESLLGDFYIRQIEHADIILLNKVDLASSEVLRDVESAVRELNPEATLLFSVQCDVDTRLILDGDASGLVGTSATAGTDTGLPATSVMRADHRHDHETHSADGDRGEYGHLHDVESFVVETTGGFTRSSLQSCFDALPDNVWRAKGFMSVDGRPSLIQYSLGQLVVATAAEPPHRNLVFIGRRMDRAAIERRFGSASLPSAPVAGA
jgi:G3E family GTPase